MIRRLGQVGSIAQQSIGLDAGAGNYGNATAGDVRAGKTIGTESGLITGTMEEGSRARSGTETSTVDYVSGWYYRRITVSGLGFKPTSTRVSLGNNPAAVLVAANSDRTSYHNGFNAYNLVNGTSYYTLASSMGSEGNQFEVNNNGFSIIIECSTSSLGAGGAFSWTTFG